MKALDIISRAGRSLKSAKARTLLTSLAIAVGAFTLSLTLAAGNGIREYTDRLVKSNFDPAASIVGRDKEIENTGAADGSPKEYDESISSISFGGSGDSLQVKQMTDKDIEDLRSKDFIEKVRPNYQMSARYISGKNDRRYTLGVQAFDSGQKPEVVAGELPADDVAKGQVLLPEAYVSLLGFASAREALGQKVTIAVEEPFTKETLQDLISQQIQGSGSEKDLTTKQHAFTYTVQAVTKKGVASLTSAGLPVYLSSQDAKSLYDVTTKGTPQYGKYLYASVRVKGGEDDAVALAAKQRLKKEGYYVMTSQDIQKTIRQFVTVLQSLVAVFGLITVIASVFGIINTMYISVLERTREIGLMKALGMRSRNVAWLFRIEAAWIGFIGGALGVLSAWLVTLAVNPWLTKKLSLGDGNTILIHDIRQIVGLILALILVAIIAGWLPARKAAKLDPIEALRTE